MRQQDASKIDQIVQHSIGQPARMTAAPSGNGSRPEPAWLIVNADDYGYYDCVSRGILHSARRGIVTATGMFATASRFDEHVAWLRDFETLDLGLHLNLTSQTPLTRGMRDKTARWGGRFPGKFPMAGAVLSRRIEVKDVEREWRAQIERCLNEGLQLRFINSHEHIHMLPGLFPMVQGLAREYGIPHVRLPTAETLNGWGGGALVRDAAMRVLAAFNRRHLATPAPRFLGMGPSGRLSFDYLSRALPTLESGDVYELMCHPGQHDAAEVDEARLLDYHDWEGELAVLTSPEVKGLLTRHGVRLIGYRDLVTEGGRLRVRDGVNGM
jgi:predicted glycoside hydrolase/deacetylase ChbG (UPF0249 family)